MKEIKSELKEKLTYISRDLYEALYLLKQYKNKIPDDAALAIEKFLMTDPIITPYTFEQRAYEIQRYKEAIYILEKWSNELPEAVFLEIIRRSGIIVNNQASCEYDDSGPWSDLWHIGNKRITREKSEGFSMHTESYREIERQRDKYMVFNELPLNQEQRKDFINNIRNKCFSAEIIYIKDDNKLLESTEERHIQLVSHYTGNNGKKEMLAFCYPTSNKDPDTFFIAPKQYINKDPAEQNKEQRGRILKYPVKITEEQLIDNANFITEEDKIKQKKKITRIYRIF